MKLWPNSSLFGFQDHQNHTDVSKFSFSITKTLKTKQLLANARLFKPHDLNNHAAVSKSEVVQAPRPSKPCNGQQTHGYSSSKTLETIQPSANSKLFRLQGLENNATASKFVVFQAPRPWKLCNGQQMQGFSSCKTLKTMKLQANASGSKTFQTMQQSTNSVLFRHKDLEQCNCQLMQDYCYSRVSQHPKTPPEPPKLPNWLAKAIKRVPNVSPELPKTSEGPHKWQPKAPKVQEAQHLPRLRKVALGTSVWPHTGPCGHRKGVGNGRMGTGRAKTLATITCLTSDRTVRA